MRILLIGGCGYVGSALFRHFETQGHDVVSIDLEWRGNPGGIKNRKVDYRMLLPSFVLDVDAAVWIAGHSTVAACIADPTEAFANNAAGLIQFAQLLGGKPLIYASSGSVYDSEGTGRFRNMYDLSKFAADEAMKLCRQNFYALRFGTVCGVSPNPRWDLMLNGMVRSAVQRRAIDVWNQRARRPLLGLRDLCRAVETIVANGGEPGIYDLATCETTIGALASKVAAMCGATITEKQGPAGYDFTMGRDKFVHAFGFEFAESVESMVLDVKRHLEEMN